MKWNVLLISIVALSTSLEPFSSMATTTRSHGLCQSRGLELFSEGRTRDAIAAWRDASPTDPSAVAILRILRSWDGFDVEGVAMEPVASSLSLCTRQARVGAEVIVGTIKLLDPTLSFGGDPHELFAYADRSGHPYAPLGMAVLAERRSDRAAARKHIADSVARGPTEMGHRAGLLYLSEVFVPSDPNEGAAYLKEAADRGAWQSQDLMSVLYAEGVGVVPNLAEAARYKKLAADNPLRDDTRNADAAIEWIAPSSKRN